MADILFTLLKGKWYFSIPVLWKQGKKLYRFLWCEKIKGRSHKSIFFCPNSELSFQFLNIKVHKTHITSLPSVTVTSLWDLMLHLPESLRSQPLPLHVFAFILIVHSAHRTPSTSSRAGDRRPGPLHAGRHTSAELHSVLWTPSLDQGIPVLSVIALLCTHTCLPSGPRMWICSGISDLTCPKPTSEFHSSSQTVSPSLQLRIGQCTKLWTCLSSLHLT